MTANITPARLSVPPTDIPSLRSLVHALRDDQLSYEDDAESDNVLRASWAGIAVLAFADKMFAGGDNEDFTTVIGDLLADVMHLCDLLDLDFGSLCDQGRSHYVPELAGGV